MQRQQQEVWEREECVPCKDILANVLASGHDDFTAIEDIVDNSVEALSSVRGEAGYKPEIHVTITDSCIEILDNGCGMSNAQARNAMRLGSHMVQEGYPPLEQTHFLFGSGRLGHFGVGGKAGACKLGNVLEYTTRQKGDAKVTVVRFHPGVASGEAKSLWEQEFMTREPVGDEVKMPHFTRVTISDLKCDPRKSFCYDSDDTTFFRLRARLFCTYFFLINRPGDKFDTDPEADPPSHRHGLWTLKNALKVHYPDFQKCEPSFSFHLLINGSNILRALKGDQSDDVESNCPLNCILNCCYETMVDDAGRVRGENICNMYHHDASTPPGTNPKAVAICMFDRFVDGKSSFEDQFERNQMSRLALLDIHNTNLESVRADEAIERKNFRTFVFWRGRLLRHVDMHKTASNPKIPSFLQKRNKVGESYAPEGWHQSRKDVVEASERVISFIFFNEAFRPDPAKTTLQKDVQPFQSIFETDLYSQRDKHKMSQFLECISYWKMHHDEEVKFEIPADPPSKLNHSMDDEVSISLKISLPNTFEKADFFKKLIIRPSSAAPSKKKGGKSQEIRVSLDQWIVVSGEMGGAKEILKVRQFIQLFDKRIMESDSYWVRCFRPFATNDAQVNHSVRASCVQYIASNSELDALKNRVPEKFRVEISYPDESSKVHVLPNRSSFPSDASSRDVHVVENVVAGICPKLVISMLNSKGVSPDIPSGLNQPMPYLLELIAECPRESGEPKKVLSNVSPTGVKWNFDLSSQKDSMCKIHKLFGKAGDVFIKFKADVNNTLINLSEEQCILLQNAQVPFLKSINFVTIHFKIEAAPPKKLFLKLEPHPQRCHRSETSESLVCVCGEAFYIFAAAVDEFDNILEGKVTKFQIISKTISWSSTGKDVNPSDYSFQPSQLSYNDQTRCSRIGRLVFQCQLPEDSHVNIDIQLVLNIKGEQLKLTGSLPKVRIYPGAPEQIVTSLAKMRPDRSRTDARSVYEINLARRDCVVDERVGCDALHIQVLDAWGNQVRDLRHYEVVIESTASESKLSVPLGPKGDAFVALASGCRDDLKLFLVDGSRMGMGWVDHATAHHELQKHRRIWGGRSAAVGLASLEHDTFWFSSYVHNPINRAYSNLWIGNLCLGMCCAFSKDALQDLEPRVKEYFCHRCLPCKPFVKAHHVAGRIVQIFRAISDPEKVFFRVLLFVPVECSIEYDGPKYSDPSYSYLAASNICCVIEASEALCSLHVVGIPSSRNALAHFNSTCTTKTGYHSDPVVPIGTWIVTHRLDFDLQLHALSWCESIQTIDGGILNHQPKLLSFKFRTPRHFSPSLQISLDAPISEIKKMFLSALSADILRFQNMQDDAWLDGIMLLSDPVYQKHDFLSLLHHSQIRFLCDGRSLPVNLEVPLYQVFGKMINREICIWVCGPEAALSYESIDSKLSTKSNKSISPFSYQDSISIWLKSIYLSSPGQDEHTQSHLKFPPKLPLSNQDADDPEHPTVLCNVIKLAVLPSLAPRDMQFQVSGIDDIEKRNYGREVGFVFPHDAKPTLTISLLNDFHEPTLALDKLCTGVLEIRRLTAAFDAQDHMSEPIYIDINGNTIELGPNHPHYSSIVDSQQKSKLLFSLKLHHGLPTIKSSLHFDTLEGSADNLAFTFDPKLSLVPNESEFFYVTAEQPLKFDISTIDQTGRSSERGLGHIDEYIIKFSFLPAQTKGKGRPAHVHNLFTNLDPFYLDNHSHYYDVGEACDVFADRREFKFHLSHLILCGKPGKFVLRVRIIHRAGQKPELCRNLNLIIRPIVNDCRMLVNFPIDTVIEGDTSEEPLRFTSVWQPKLFERAPWTWNSLSGTPDHFFVNNYASGQIILTLNNMFLSMNQLTFEGTVEFKMISGQTFLLNDEVTSPFVIGRQQKHRPSSYSVNFRPTATISRGALRGQNIEMFFVSPPKASHCILMQWKTSIDQWDAPDGHSLLERIHFRFQAIQGVSLQPQQEIFCYPGEQTELLVAVASFDEDNRQLFLSKPDDYNILFKLHKGRNDVVSHDVDIVTVENGLGLVCIKFTAPQGSPGHEYTGTLAVSSKRFRGNEHHIVISLCKIALVPKSGYLKFENLNPPIQLVPTSKPSFYEIKNMKIRLKTHPGNPESPHANSTLTLRAHSVATMKEMIVEKNGSGPFKLRNNICDTEFLKLCIGPILPNAKVKVQVLLEDADHATNVRKSCIDLVVPPSSSEQASFAISNALHAASFADDALRLEKQCSDLKSTISIEEAKKQKFEDLKHLEASIKTVDLRSSEDLLALRQKVRCIPGCYIAGDTANVLLPVLYLQHKIFYSIQQLPPSSKCLLQLPMNSELKHSGAVLAWKLSELLQQDTFSTVIIDAKHGNRSMSPLEVHHAEELAIRNVASEFGQMKIRFLRMCSIERVDENRRSLFESCPLIAADENFITDYATPRLFDRCHIKPPQCDSVLDHPIGFLDWAVNFLHFDPSLAHTQLRLKFWLPLLHNVAIFDRAEHAEEYRKFRENPDIGLPPITILTVFDDYFFHHDSASGISSYRSAPKPDDAELYNREWGLHVAPAVDRLSCIRREIANVDAALDAQRTRLHEMKEQLLALDPTAASRWAPEDNGPHNGHRDTTLPDHAVSAQPSKRTKYGESPGNFE